MEKISELLIRHLRGQITLQESAELKAWLNESEKNRQFFEEISDYPELIADMRRLEEERTINPMYLNSAWEKLMVMGCPALVTNRPQKSFVKKWWFPAAVTAVYFILAIAIFRHWQRDIPSELPVTGRSQQPDLKPNTHKAYLTLHNGETIVLDNTANGVLATQSNMQVVKGKNGGLTYTGGTPTLTRQVIYNKVTAPSGSNVVYLQLADGTKVWLNAESSIRYPVAFINNERKVEITGEAYFEAAPSSSLAANGKEQKKPFIVNKGNMSITVLGTKFNVNTYENEDNMKVTLLEGSVKVKQDKMERTIEPGQQAIISDSKINMVENLDLQQVMAWKEGKFVFNNTNIQLIMRQMERWYDLEPTSYENEAVRQWAFNGEISRYNNAARILELLESTGSVKFKVEGKKINVIPLP